MNRIKELRRQRGVTQDRLGELLGVGKSAVSKYENEKLGVPSHVLLQLSDFFGVSPEYVLGQESETPLPASARELMGVSASPVEAAAVPLLGFVHAGSPMLAEENIEDYIPVAAGEVFDGEYFFMTVVGDCMTGDHIAEGSIVLVRRGSELKDGYIYVIRMEDEVMLRRVKRIKNGIALIPSNPAYDPMIVTGGDISVIGRVVESRMRH